MNKNNKLNILHLASYFSGVSKVYEHLFQATDKLGHTQFVYVPYRVLKKEKDIRFSIPESKVFLRPIYNKFSRVAYFYKLNKAYKDIIKQLPVTEMDITHAHTWFTDGGLAYRLYKEHNKPYVVTIRSTDLSAFAKYFYHTQKYARNILLNAKKIVFLSKAYQDRVLHLPFIKKYAQIIEGKSIIIPNGVDDFWIENNQQRKKALSEKVKLIYIGSFIDRKNLVRLIEACVLLNKKGYGLHLDLVGGSPTYSDELKELINTSSSVNFLGRVTDKNKLAELIRKSDVFVMPSYNETFGLVYIEALSQGIPVLYTQNDGIDGLYDSENIGEAVDAFDVEDIMKKLSGLIKNYEQYDFNPETIVKNHNWNLIVRKLVGTYK